MRKIKLETLVKKYREGKISREEFRRLHAILTKNGAFVVQAEAVKQRRPQVAASPPPAQYIDADIATYEVKSRFAPIKAVVKHHKQVVAALGALGIIATLVTDQLITLTSENRTDKIVSEFDNSGDIANQDPKSNVKIITSVMLRNNHWDKNLINRLIENWQKLTPIEKQETKQSNWFRQLSLLLSLQLSQQRSLADAGNITAAHQERLLSTLNQTLDIDGDNSNIGSQFAKSTRSNSSSKTRKPKTAPIKKRQKNNRIIETSRDVVKNEIQPTIYDKQKIADLVEEFIYSYENGQIDIIKSLFGGNSAKSPNVLAKKRIDDLYTIFSDTKSRSLYISNTQWDYRQNKAYGIGDYYTVLQYPDGSRKDIEAELELVLTQHNSKLYIQRLSLKQTKSTAYVPDQQENDTIASTEKISIDKVQRFEIKKKQAKRKNVAKQSFPSKGELQDLLIRFVVNYESGDIDSLMTLFSGSTWTNDENGLAVLQQEYSEIFEDTTDRKIFVNQVDWAYKNNKALGTGDLSLTRTIIENDEVKSENGKIRLVVEKNSGRIQISHLYFIFD